MFPNINIKDTEVNRNAKATDVWDGHNWRLSDSIDEVTASAWDEVKNLKIVAGQEDEVQWAAAANGKFSIQSVVTFLRGRGGKDSWAKIL